MKKKLSMLLLLSLLTLNCYSQIQFEKGYFIDNNNQKTNCLIKNKDWKNTPSEFEYKISEDEPIQKATIDKIKEFSITNIVKYVRFTVNFDPCNERTDELSTDKKANYSKKTIFLKTLTEGKASLFVFIDDYSTKYFYCIDNSNAKQLLYKLYKKVNSSIGVNESYKQQLWNDLKCKTQDINDLKKTKYTKKSLANYLNKYNECSGIKSINFDMKQNRDLFKLNLRPGINFSSLNVVGSGVPVTSIINELDDISFRFGTELEVILPINKNKWSIFIEPTFQYFKTKTSVNNISNVNFIGDLELSADYSSIEIPFGLRYYSFLNTDSKIFFNASYVLDYTLKESFIDYTPGVSKKEIKSGPGLAFGTGYKFKNKYSIEIRWYSKRDLLNRYLLWKSNYQTTSIILGYTLFNKKR